MDKKKLSSYITPFLLSCLIVTVTACSESGGSSSLDTLPIARGASGELLLVMDSALWQSELGDELRQTFLKAMPGLPQAEPYFSVRYIDPFKLNKVLRSAKNMLFVATLDNQSIAGKKMKSFFTQSSVDRIESDPNLYQFSKKNQFARGQEVLFLFGQSDEALIENLKDNRKEIRNHFHEIEIDRLQSNLYKANERRTINRTLLEKEGFYIRVPYGYEQVPKKNTEDFVWIRSLGDEVDKSVFVAYKEYTSEEAFKPENILDFREEMSKKYLADDSTVHMTIQSEIPIEFDTVNFNGKYAIEARGLWKLNNNSMGGPFLSYTFVDEESGRLYYIEGFIYSPGKQKRPFIREIEAILHTFRTASEMEKKQATS
ncbi:hypothetical protein OKW21_000412 [Catalinimonas alkaloidigena]|uniref:DUF4837 family protein n=1 Tax=Catalinimonas alkaloidigena TaxID=1075417 RepID=UPI0024055FD1|nr:DUF4837 family protein [Catalinimonas alkaloidigena]MDF9795149.1 hypothetical protein [Catalinimonas alkaloidigena]